MFERFTERARQVVVLAQDEARALGHGYIGTEHLLLGILREEEGLGARVLRALEVTVEDARAEVERIVGRGEELPAGQIPFTPHAKRALELSLREALSLGHNFIGTEHVLLGLVRAGDGVAAQVLASFRVDAERVRTSIVSTLSGRSVRGDSDPADLPYTREWWARRNAFAPPPEEWPNMSSVEMTFADSLPPPVPVADPGADREPMLLRGLLIGWALASATLGGGLLLGWLIWG